MRGLPVCPELREGTRRLQLALRFLNSHQTSPSANHHQHQTNHGLAYTWVFPKHGFWLVQVYFFLVHMWLICVWCHQSPGVAGNATSASREELTRGEKTNIYFPFPALPSNGTSGHIDKELTPQTFRFSPMFSFLGVNFALIEGRKTLVLTSVSWHDDFKTVQTCKKRNIGLLRAAHDLNVTLLDSVIKNA